MSGFAGAKGFMIAAPHSGAGKTVLTLGLLAAFRGAGVDVRAAKSGPDYIDPDFHRFASGHASVNLDAWAMSAETLLHLAHCQGGELLVVEAAMGVLDGAFDGRGSPAELARALNLPIILVIDCSAQAQSAILSALGFLKICPDLTLGGVILNKIASPSHGERIRACFREAGIDVLGIVRKTEGFALDTRHLGLVQARELSCLTARLKEWARELKGAIGLDGLYALARPLARSLKGGASLQNLEMLGQHTAIADDKAFAFTYPHLLEGWRRAGGEVSFFSPLANQAPVAHADAVFLPGGYPELFAPQIAKADKFKKALRAFGAKGGRIYGECGGYMTLGAALIDAKGKAHEMLDLLPLVSSFEKRKLTLGYRTLRPQGGYFRAPLFYGHEFHYATIISQGKAQSLFEAEESGGATLGEIGLRRGNIAGSFAHLIAPA